MYVYISCSFFSYIVYHVRTMYRSCFMYRLYVAYYLCIMYRLLIVYRLCLVHRLYIVHHRCIVLYCSCDRLLTVEQESVRPHNLEAHLRPRKVKTPPWQKQLDVIIRLYSVYLTKFCVAKNVLCKQETFWALVLNQ